LGQSSPVERERETFSADSADLDGSGPGIGPRARNCQCAQNWQCVRQPFASRSDRRTIGSPPMDAVSASLYLLSDLAPVAQEARHVSACRALECLQRRVATQWRDPCDLLHRGVADRAAWRRGWHSRWPWCSQPWGPPGCAMRPVANSVGSNAWQRAKLQCVLIFLRIGGAHRKLRVKLPSDCRGGLQCKPSSAATA
jgi:hypothetical protein